jgi:hypothetical protein
MFGAAFAGFGSALAGGGISLAANVLESAHNATTVKYSFICAPIRWEFACFVKKYGQNGSYGPGA